MTKTVNKEIGQSTRVMSVLKRIQMVMRYRVGGSLRSEVARATSDKVTR